MVVLLPFQGEDEEELELQINFDEWVQGEDTGKLELKASVCVVGRGGICEVSSWSPWQGAEARGASTRRPPAAVLRITVFTELLNSSWPLTWTATLDITWNTTFWL